MNGKGGETGVSCGGEGKSREERKRKKKKKKKKKKREIIWGEVP
jgi:hypothetical protein